jgi:hypothetical protein
MMKPPRPAFTSGLLVKVFVWSEVVEAAVSLVSLMSRVTAVSSAAMDK